MTDPLLCCRRLPDSTVHTPHHKHHEQGTQFQLHMQSLEIPVHASSLVALLKKPTAGSAAAASAGGLLLGEVKQEKPRCVVSV